ncbi:MAG: hypothetical protein OXF56_07000 [Rhodobacteraceae bacterium]|nr:hypothetical protein [Paracoccaceae bacterium]
MKITRIRATPVNIQFTAPRVFSRGSMKPLTGTIVELDTDVGETVFPSFGESAFRHDNATGCQPASCRIGWQFASS